MITFNSRPAMVQDWPITGWKGLVPKRGEESHLKVSLDLNFHKGDSSKVNALIKAVEELMDGATFKDSGNPVLPTKLAKLLTGDGRTATVPAETLPAGMMIGKEQEDGQGEQSEGVQQGEGASLQETIRPHLQEAGVCDELRLTLSPDSLPGSKGRDSGPEE